MPTHDKKQWYSLQNQRQLYWLNANKSKSNNIHCKTDGVCIAWMLIRCKNNGVLSKSAVCVLLWYWIIAKTKVLIATSTVCVLPYCYYVLCTELPIKDLPRPPPSPRRPPAEIDFRRVWYTKGCILDGSGIQKNRFYTRGVYKRMDCRQEWYAKG